MSQYRHVKKDISYYNFGITEFRGDACSGFILHFFFLHTDNGFRFVYRLSRGKRARLFMAARLMSVLRFPALIAHRYAVTCPSPFFPRAPLPLDPVESRGIIHYP